MSNSVVPRANPKIVLREEFDDWGILFDPETGDAYGLDPVGIFYWKRLDGKRSKDDLIKDLIAECDDVPEEAPAHLEAFIESLVERGFALFNEE